MNYIKTAIEGVYIIEPKVFSDSRGYFMETWKQAEFNENVYKVDFMQENESKSSYGVVRGLHYQCGEFSQAKHVMVELSDTNKRQLFIPRGFAHGFAVLSDEAIFTYKVDNVYAPQTEACIRWNDPALGIKWPLPEADVMTSEKDMRGVTLSEAETF